MLSQRIKKARESAKLSQEELAKKLNIGKRTLIDYEKGASEPKVSTLLNIAKYCNTDPIWLLLGETNHTHNENKPNDLETICTYIKDLNQTDRKKVLKYVLELQLDKS